MEENKAMALWWLAIASGLLVAAFSATQIDEISCGEAVPLLLPCKSYLDDSGPAVPSVQCCSGVQTVYKRADTTQNRRDLCECFKKLLHLYPLDQGRAKQLPQFCKIKISFPLDPDIDCNKINVTMTEKGWSSP